MLWWTVPACMLVWTVHVDYETYHLGLILDSYKLRDYYQQSELDRVQGRAVALQRSLDHSRAVIAGLQAENARLKAQLPSPANAPASPPPVNPGSSR